MTKARQVRDTPTASRVPQKEKLCAQDTCAVIQLLESFALLPFHICAAGRNQSVPSLLHDATGLSKARISKGNLGAIRPSTQKKIDAHLQKQLTQQFKNNPQALARLQQKFANPPKTSSGANAPWAGFMDQLEFLPEISMGISKAVALAVDELVETLLSACRNNELCSFKQAVLSHLNDHGLAVRLGNDPVAFPAPSADQSAWQAMESWEQATGLVHSFLEHLYWDLISTLDAEWCGTYFRACKAMPMFPLVMVRPQAGLVENLKITSRKNVFFRPSRRLLEFLYAVVFYIRHKKWPAKQPSPRVLGDILYRPGQTELPGASLINNYFDGTAKLTVELVIDHWHQMFAHFMPERQEADRPNPPLPMIGLALHWQKLLIQDNGRSFILSDLDGYQALWAHRHCQWKSQQADRDKDVIQTGHKTGEPIAWPVWMLSQSSSASSLAS